MVETAGVADVPSAIPEYPAIMVEAAGAHDVPSAAQAFLARFIDAAAAHDIDPGFGAVAAFVITERVGVHDELEIIQIGSAFVIERARGSELWIGLPKFLGAIVEQAGAHDAISYTGTMLALARERAGARDVVEAGGSTFSFGIAEHAGAHDVPDARIMRFIAIVEAAQARDASFSLSDLWVPVNDGQSGIWVPVNDNPAGPWLPVIP